MCITKCIDHFVLIKPEVNVAYVLISSLIFSITMVAMCLIDRRTFLNSKIKNSTDPKIMLIQLPFLISLSTSIFICLINAFILKYKNNRFVHASDLTAAELQLRGTVEDRSIIFDL